MYAGVIPFLGVLLLWIVFVIDHSYALGIDRFGILPREWSGLSGVVAAPFLHGDAEHLFNNSIPLLLLGWCMMHFYPRVAGKVILYSWVGGGMLVWITARPDMHIGASGVVYGMAAFLFFSGFIRRQRALMAISLLVVFLYGGMVWGVLPLMPRVSWESHLWGGLVGAFMAWRSRYVAPSNIPPQVVLADDDDDATPGVGPLIITYHTDPGDEDDQPARNTDARRTGTALDGDRTDIMLP